MSPSNPTPQTGGGSDAELLAAARAGMTLPRWRALHIGMAPDGPIADAAVVWTPASYSFAIPFDAFCRDNAKYGVIDGKLLLTRRYRAAKGMIKRYAREQYAGPVFDKPVSLEAKVWFPRDIGDAPNLAKCCHDALEGVCYLNDRLIHDARWRRAGVDKQQPRVELTLTPLV